MRFVFLVVPPGRNGFTRVGLGRGQLLALQRSQVKLLQALGASRAMLS